MERNGGHTVIVGAANENVVTMYGVPTLLRGACRLYQPQGGVFYSGQPNVREEGKECGEEDSKEWALFKTNPFSAWRGCSCSERDGASRHCTVVGDYTSHSP